MKLWRELGALPQNQVNECNGDVTTAIGRRPENNYFVTHTMNVNSSFSSCPVISQQPGVGNVNPTIM
jgi:hypothetical protein